jgi:hypothetical protein
MYQSGVPGWIVALALALAFSAAVAVVAVATGFFVILVPALAVVALGYGLYVAVVARRRRAGVWRHLGVIEDGRALRRRSRLARRGP